MSGAYGSSHWLYDAEPFEQGQSLKFNDDDSTYLSRTPASAGNRRTWTWSAWVKLGAMSHGSNQITLFDASSSASDQHGIVYSGQQFYVFGYAGGFTYRKMLTALHRDPSAWFHYTVAFDTTDSTASDRIKIYVNGVIQTSFDGTNTDPSLNFDTGFNNTVAHGLGGRVYDGANFFDGYMADVYLIDGQALDPTSFIKTENNQLKPKEYFGSYGTNGFRLNFQDDVISEGFNATVWRGTAADNSISGLGFSPAFVWIKDRTDATAQYLFDVNRGALKDIYANLTNAQYSAAETLKSFDSDGFTLGNNTGVNGSADDMVAWCWEGGGTPTATNSAGAGATPTAGSVKIDGSNLASALAGTIPATKISANTVKGFSVVQFEGTSTAGSVAHGLESAPKFIIAKNIDSVTEWPVYHDSVNSGGGSYLRLNGNYANTSSSIIWTASPTDTVVNIGTYEYVNRDTMIMYCFAEVSGYSKFGSFTGNGGSQEITVGFRPALVVLKRSSTTSNWHVFDATRNGDNPRSSALQWDLTNAEATNANMQFTDTGFNDNGYVSDNGATILYMAFADTREAAFFKDVSGNNNNFTPNNLDYRDSMIDTPLTNFAVGNPLTSTSNNTFSEGNLKVTGSGVNYYNYASSIAMQSGNKYYFEVYSNRRDSSYWAVGICETGSFTHGMSIYNTAGSMALEQGKTVHYLNSAIGTTTNRYNSTAYLFSFAIDLDNNIFHFRADGGTWENSGDPAGGSGGYAIPAAMQGKTLLPWFGPNGGNFQILNFGQDSSFSGIKIPQGNGADGEDFFYAPPTGFKSLQLSNLPTPAIADPTAHFDIVTYTGTGSTNSIGGLSFQPDWVWGKRRDTTGNHWLNDAVRGATKGLHSDSTNTEYTDATVMNAFTSDGFTVVSHAISNASSGTYVAWNWKAGGATPSQTYTVKVVSDSGNKYRFDDFGTSAITLDLQEGGTYTFDQSDSSNSGHPLRFSTTSDGTHGSGSEYTTGVTTNGTAGSAGAYTRITVAASAPTLYYYCTVHSGMGGQANTNSTFGSTNVKGTIQSVASANTTSGFSIVTYTGNNTAGATVGHSLSSPPEMIWIKGRVATGADGNWNVYAKTQGDVINETDYLLLNSNTSVTDESAAFNDTAATSSVFSLGTFADSNGSGKTFVAYCFHSVEGFSKIGTYYVTSASTDGEFIHTGFRVTFVLIKSLASGEDWEIWDGTRDPVNVTTKRLKANTSGADVTSTFIDFLSNGFKLRNTSGGYNSSSNNFLYMAFSESPFKTASAR